MKTRTFIDSVTIHATGGNGGNGCVGFRREKFVPYGGPDGGDGGRGGHVILQGDHDTDSLVRFFYSPEQRAPAGGHGRGQKCTGRNGQDLILKVPCGTVVRRQDSGELVGDVVEHGQQLIVAGGGRGGLGNCHWKSATHQAPREHTDGEPGEAVTLQLDLKIVADVGLVGFPNAGKSSLITRLSDAHPKIAAYPFTTLNPIIGTLIYDDFFRVKIADIPGLIKGAHAGAGLGYEFLRHIERTTALVFVIDMAGVDTRVPHEDYLSLRAELAQYQAEMLERPSLVVANKMDLPEAAENLKVFKRKTKTKPLAVSAVTGDGIPELKAAIHALYPPPAKRPRARRRTAAGYSQNKHGLGDD